MLYPQEKDTSSNFHNYLFSADGSLRNIYRESSAEKLTVLEGYSFSSGFTNNDDLNRFALQIENSSLSFKNQLFKSGIATALEYSGKSISFSYSRQFDFIALGTGLKYIRHAGKYFYNYDTYLKIAFKGVFPVSYEASFSRNRLPVSFTTAYKDEGILLINPIEYSSFGQSIRWKSGQFELSAANTQFFASREPGTDVFSLRNNSGIEIWQAAASFTKKRYELRFGIFDFQIKNSFDLLNNGLEFGSIRVNQFHLLNLYCDYSASIRNIKLAAGVAASYGCADLTGSIESWPFSSVLLSVFVNRLYFHTGGKIQYQKIDLSAVFPVNSISLKSEIELYRIKPDLFIETWRPAFLVFGVLDKNKSELDLKDAGLMIISANAEFSISVVNFNLNASQVLPLYILRSSAKSVTAGQKPEEKPVLSSTGGGRWFSVRISLPFN